MGLVKQICVSSNQAVGGYNRPYVKLLSVSNEDGFKARLEIDVQGKDGKVSRKTVTAKPGTDLYKLSGYRACMKIMPFPALTVRRAWSKSNYPIQMLYGWDAP